MKKREEEETERWFYHELLPRVPVHHKLIEMMSLCVCERESTSKKFCTVRMTQSREEESREREKEKEYKSCIRPPWNPDLKASEAK